MHELNLRHFTTMAWDVRRADVQSGKHAGYFQMRNCGKPWKITENKAVLSH